jgi:hypothetical protein
MSLLAPGIDLLLCFFVVGCYCDVSGAGEVPRVQSWSQRSS